MHIAMRYHQQNILSTKASLVLTTSLVMFRFVRCTDFIEFLCVSARGSRLERASLCFRICDVSGRGAISRADLGRVLDSVAELVGCGSLGRADTVIDRIFARSDLKHHQLN